MSFRTVHLCKKVATRSVRLVTLYLWVFKPAPFSISLTRRSKGGDCRYGSFTVVGPLLVLGFALLLWIGAWTCTVPAASHSVNCFACLVFRFGSAVVLCLSGQQDVHALPARRACMCYFGFSCFFILCTWCPTQRRLDYNLWEGWGPHIRMSLDVEISNPPV